MTHERPMLMRLLRGAEAQIVSHIIRVLVQLGMIGVLLPLWGLHLYGEWLVLSAVPSYLAVGDFGLFSAAQIDMTMAVGRGDRDQARDVFQAISRGVVALILAAGIALPAAVAIAPVSSWLHFTAIGEPAASVAFVTLALRTLLIMYTSMLYGGFASDGNYGEGTMFSAGIGALEFLALFAVAATGYGPASAAIAMLICRLAGMAAMYATMRHRSPWLKLGKPIGKPEVIKRLWTAGLASAAIEAGLALNLQGMVILIGVVLSPASTAIFTTVRTLARIVIQLLTSISQVVAPEIAKAHGAGDTAMLRQLLRRASQTAVWTGTPILLALALLGDPLIRVWTSGTVSASAWLLYLLLIGAGIDTLWLTSGSILVWTNRHQRVSAIYMAVSFGSLLAAYKMLHVSGLTGAALVLVVMEVVMLVVVLPPALRAADDTLSGWAATVFRPPSWAFTALRVRLAGVRRGSE